MKKLKKENTRLGCSDLTLGELQDTYRMRSRGNSIQEISLYVGRSKSTVSEALNDESLSKSNKHLPWYEKAKVVYDARKKRRGRPRDKGWGLKNEATRRYVIGKLEDKYSPKSISLKIGKDHPGLSICHESIYQYIYRTDRSLLKYLTRYGKRKSRSSGEESRSENIRKRYIDKRSEEANKREELGHKESDFIVSCRGGKSCILVAVDRKVRRIRLIKTANREADTTRGVLFRVFRDSEVVKSLTVDNDPAHNHLPLLEPIFRKEELKIFFCEPYSPWQRGSVEAIIGILRRWFPKGTNFDEISEEKVRYVEDWFNDRPMEVLGGKSPNEAYEQELKRIAA